MKNWSDTIKSLSPEAGDNITDLKIKVGEALLLQGEIKVNKELQLAKIAEQTKIDDILDHHKIYKIIEDLEMELNVQMELLGIRISELKKQLA